MADRSSPEVPSWLNKAAALAWRFLLVVAALFVVFVAEPTISSEVTRVEVGYCGAALVLAGLLWAVYRRERP